MKRDITLDSLRGLLLVVMTIDHLGISFSNYTIHTLGFITAAEGFIFLSGFVAGLVYSKIRERQGEAELWRVGLRRARIIYLSHMSIFLLILLISFISKEMAFAWKSTIPYFSDPLLINQPLRALGLAALLLYQPAYFDILPLYFFFLLITPLLLGQFMRGRAKTVIAISAGIWLIGQLGVRSVLKDALAGMMPVELGFFDIFGWQLLFVGGLFFGFNRYRQNDRGLLNNRALLASCAALALILFLLRHEVIGGGLSEVLVSRERLGILRVLNFAAIAYLLACARVHLSKILTWRWFTSLGQHSLQVYAFHVVLIFLIAPLVPELRSLSQPMAAAVTIVSVSSLSIPAWFHRLYRERARI